MPALNNRMVRTLAVKLALAAAFIGATTPLAALSHAHLAGTGAEVMLVGVVFAAFFGGIPSALFATVFAALSMDLFVLPPRYRLEPTAASHWIHAVAFLVAALVVSTLYAAVRRSEARVQGLLEDERASKEELERLTAELRDANEVKDEFIGLVSHELKTPLTTIIMNAQYLHRTAALEGEGGVVLDEMESEGLRLAAIIDNLLALARLERGEEITLEPVALARVVKRVVMRHQDQHPERQFVLNLDPRVVAQASPVSVEQVVHNLISNAEKYSPEGQPVTVGVQAAGHDAIVQVADRGPGIPAPDVPHIFEPFYRSTSTAGRASGLGVGLAVCKRLIEAESGQIWFEPEDGRSVFRFSLPLAGDRGADAPGRPAAVNRR
jgi:signal transduction histidine kinase